MKILVINSGSSSLKYQLFDMTSGEVLAKGLCERIGGECGIITHKRPGHEPYKAEPVLPDHGAALSLVLGLITDKELGVIEHIDEIEAVGHRVAHGGEMLKSSSLIGEKELEYLYSIVDINPLHGPPAIKGIEACKKLLPKVPQVGVFDTSYYSTIPDYTYICPLPYEYYEKYKIRRYGFHGTSHRFVTAECAKIMGKPLEELKIITCHMGNGSSITATKYGKALDTSMGFTPQDGLIMGTRSGAIDPTVLTYIMKTENVSAQEMDDIINRKSGLLGVSGVSNDCREIWEAADAGNKRAKLALDMLINDVKKIVGSYLAEMNGADALVFTAGIGENDFAVREGVCRDMDFFGIKIDEEKNKNAARGEFNDITAPDGKMKVFIIPTDEEYMIAKDTQNLVK
ncbi:MAG: acetate kinase [Ruminococcaceae bacterium]|nr:acetate kinase [Oscillospiraceae bacterium]